MNLYHLAPYDICITDWQRNIILCEGDITFERHNKFYATIPKLELKAHSTGDITRKATDAVDCHVLGYYRCILVNYKLKELLAQFKLPDCHFFPTKVLFRKKNYDYYFFHFSVDEIDKLIQREKSDFNFEYKTMSEPIYKKNGDLINSGGLRSFKKLTISKDVEKYDLFSTSDMLPSEAFISDRLKDALVKNNITGFDRFYPIDWVVFE